MDRASRIAAWRELASYKDPVQPVGPAPKMGAVELRAAWRGAADAAGLSKDDQGIRETPEMQLVAQAREAARVKAWEPADVSEERRDAELAKGEAVAEALMSEAAARNAEGPDAAKAQELATGFRQLAQGLSVRAAWLGEQDEHRREWHAANAAKVARGVQARAELERRREAGEFIGEWDIAMAYFTLKSDLEPPEAAAEPGSEPVTGSAAEPGIGPEADPRVEAVAELKVEAAGPAEAEVVAEPEVEAIPEPGPEAEAEVEAPVDQALGENEAEASAEDRAEHFREVAEHRERAVEHPGRAESLRSTIEAIRASQARINEERAEYERGEHPFTHREPEPQAEAERSPEAGDR